MNIPLRVLGRGRRNEIDVRWLLFGVVVALAVAGGGLVALAERRGPRVAMMTERAAEPQIAPQPRSGGSGCIIALLLVIALALVGIFLLMFGGVFLGLLAGFAAM